MSRPSDEERGYMKECMTAIHRARACAILVSDGSAYFEGLSDDFDRLIATLEKFGREKVTA